MSAVGIFAIAYGSTHERFNSFHRPPEVSDYIASVKPTPAGSLMKEGGLYAVIDTTQQGCVVSAASSVEVPVGKDHETREFSYWLLKADPQAPALAVHCRELALERGETGIIGLYFGLPTRPLMNWPVKDAKKFDEFVQIMMRHAPGWEPPLPGGPMPLKELLEVTR